MEASVADTSGHPPQPTLGTTNSFQFGGSSIVAGHGSTEDSTIQDGGKMALSATRAKKKKKGSCHWVRW